MRPSGFAQDLAGQWSHWVLGHGLPEIPHRLAVGESVPVASWIGPTTAAALHVRRVVDDEAPAPYLEIDVDLFVRAGSTWASCGGGGANWPGSRPSQDGDGSPIRPDVSPQHAELDGMTSGRSPEGGCTALWGTAGTAAVAVEVEQDGRRTRARSRRRSDTLPSTKKRWREVPCSSRAGGAAAGGYGA